MSLIISKVVTSVICDRYDLDILQLEPRHTPSFTQHRFVSISLKETLVSDKTTELSTLSSVIMVTGLIISFNDYSHQVK